MSVIKWKKGRICFIFVVSVQLLLFVSVNNVSDKVKSSLSGVLKILPDRLFSHRDNCRLPWQRRVYPNKHHLADDTNRYFSEYGELFCFNAGIDPARAVLNSTDCRCLPGWYGITCSVPEVVYLSDLRTSLSNISLRDNPRRIINAFPFNAEFEMLEARLGEIGDLVDVFIILESNYSMFGDAKPLRLLNKMKNEGAYSEYWCKMIYIVLDYFPGDAYNNGWLIDDLLRNHLANESLLHLLGNVRNDDIYLQTDADELPNRDTLLFLKNHNGFPSVTGFHLRNSIFGFFWLHNSIPVHIVLATTVGFLVNVFKYEAIKIRSAMFHIKDDQYKRKTLEHELIAFLKTNKTSWSFGSASGPTAGWHCSYCCDIDCVRTKLMSAPNSDLPRWGNDKNKLKIEYIRSRISRGLYFDNKRLFESAGIKDPLYAPAYVLKNPAKFLHILELPWAKYENASWRNWN